MSNEMTAEGRMLERHLQKWVTGGQVRNARMRPTYAHPGVPLGQIVIAEVVNRKGESAFFAETGFVLPGRGFVKYDQIHSASMLPTGAAGLKRDDFDQIQIQLLDGSTSMLTGLEQAVFPLLTFLEWVIEQRQSLEGPAYE